LVGHRADPAQALDHHWNLPVRSTFNELLEASELNDVQARLLHTVLVVEKERHLAVALYARHHLDRDSAQAFGSDGGL